MQSETKVRFGIAIAIAVFVFAVFLESTIRSSSGGPMAIDGLPVNGASVTGTWTPDFLWSGKAWRIEILSEEDLELRLDGNVYTIPQGSHEIYSNHDRTNTDQFGDQAFWGYPEDVEVRSLESK